MTLQEEFNHPMTTVLYAPQNVDNTDNMILYRRKKRNGLCRYVLPCHASGYCLCIYLEFSVFVKIAVLFVTTDFSHSIVAMQLD